MSRKLQDPNDLLRELQQGNTAAGSTKEEELSPTTKLHLDVTNAKGKRYQHTFVYSVPTNGDRILMGKLRAKFTPDGTGGDFTAMLIAEQIAYLTVCLDQEHLPSWWKPWEMYDLLPIATLYKEALDYEGRFHGTGGKEAQKQYDDLDQESTETVGSEEVSEPGVVRKAQHPAKRSEIIISSGR